MTNKMMAARKRALRLIPMPILEAVEISPSYWLEVVFAEVKLLVLVMLIAFSEKISPETLRICPAAGCCSQPALRAKRTVTVSLILELVVGPDVAKLLTVCHVVRRARLKATHAVVDDGAVEGTAVSLTISILCPVRCLKVAGLERFLQRRASIFQVAR